MEEVNHKRQAQYVMIVGLAANHKISNWSRLEIEAAVMLICVWVQTFLYHSLSTGQFYCPGSILLCAFTVLHQILLLSVSFRIQL